MQFPIIRGLIDRRILVNYRVDPNVLAELLPAPFQPKIVRGYGVAGVCLIRLKQIRPRFLPAAIGIGSENAAHRIAVEWEQDGAVREGVFIPRRDTSSCLNSWAGGRIFPGQHHHAHFQVHEEGNRVSLALTSDDGQTHVAIEGRTGDELPANSVFRTREEASDFFQRGSLGYSVSDEAGKFDGLELRCRTWSLAPLTVEHALSSFFDDSTIFPAGSARFESAFLMRKIEHEWHARAPLFSTSEKVPLSTRIRSSLATPEARSPAGN